MAKGMSLFLHDAAQRKHKQVSEIIVLVYSTENFGGDGF